MASVKNIQLNLEIGQEILVGPNNDKATITKIEYHKNSGDIELKTTKGIRKALTFRLCENKANDFINPADKYRQETICF